MRTSRLANQPRGRWSAAMGVNFIPAVVGPLVARLSLEGFDTRDLKEAKTFLEELGT